jgi:hypothetical protein
MHEPINVKSPNNISKWQMGFNLAFKGLKTLIVCAKRFDLDEKDNSCAPAYLEKACRLTKSSVISKPTIFFLGV